MNDQLPTPPYPAETRAKGWRFELDHERIRQSDTWAIAPADVRPWLLMLWMVAWEQTPVASLPDDDALIAARLGMSTKAYSKARPILLRGWWKAEDGRLYHDVMCERVTAMLGKREKDQKRTAAARSRIASSNEEVTQSSPLVTRDTPVSSTPSTKHQEPEDQEKEPTALSAAPTVPCPYQQIVDLYHAKLPMLPRVRLMGAARQRAMRKTWGWVLSSSKSDGTRRATTAEEALQWLAGYFDRAAENDFLMGRTQRSGEHAGWQCDIDFLLTEKGMRQVIEKTQERAA